MLLTHTHTCTCNCSAHKSPVGPSQPLWSWHQHKKTHKWDIILLPAASCRRPYSQCHKVCLWCHCKRFFLLPKTLNSDYNRPLGCLRRFSIILFIVRCLCAAGLVSVSLKTFRSRSFFSFQLWIEEDVRLHTDLQLWIRWDFFTMYPAVPYEWPQKENELNLLYWNQELVMQQQIHATCILSLFWLHLCDSWGILRSISKQVHPDSWVSVEMEAVCARDQFWCGVKAECLIKHRAMKKTPLIIKNESSCTTLGNFKVANPQESFSV